MQCDICSRPGGHKLPFLCPTDARNQLYEGRIRQARILIENEALSEQINRILEGRNTSSQTPEEQGAADRAEFTKHESAKGTWDVARAVAEKDQTADRTRDIIARAEALRSTIEAARADIARRRAVMARRRSEHASASNGTEARRARLIEEAEKKTRITKFKWNQLHFTATHSRSFLCSEAAKLYGLRRRRDDDLWHEEYGIGGVGIVDLRSMNTASAAQITTALGHIAHLLVLSTHYLAIQLPAEITLPHRDYPLPTIFSLASSHMNHKVPFPGSASQSGPNSPTATTQEKALDLPRPRPLYIHKPLPLLVKEDPSTYGLFVEGVALLAYNITWVCKSQGIPVGDSTSFEDICDIGRNLFNLLIGNQPRPGLPSRTSSAQSTPSRGRPREDSDVSPEDARKIAAIGHFSHGTAHTFLAGAEGTELVRSWRLSTPIKLADKLKAHLLAELHNAEWEVLDHNAWTQEEDGEDDGVVVGGHRRIDERLRMTAAGQSFMSMRTVGNGDAAELRSGEKKPGTSGWTKLKPRMVPEDMKPSRKQYRVVCGYGEELVCAAKQLLKQPKDLSSPLYRIVVSEKEDEASIREHLTSKGSTVKVNFDDNEQVLDVLRGSDAVGVWFTGNPEKEVQHSKILIDAVEYLGIPNFHIHTCPPLLPSSSIKSPEHGRAKEVQDYIVTKSMPASFLIAKEYMRTFIHSLRFPNTTVEYKPSANEKTYFEVCHPFRSNIEIPVLFVRINFQSYILQKLEVEINSKSLPCFQDGEDRRYLITDLWTCWELRLHHTASLSKVAQAIPKLEPLTFDDFQTLSNIQEYPDSATASLWRRLKSFENHGYIGINYYNDNISNIRNWAYQFAVYVTMGMSRSKRNYFVDTVNESEVIILCSPAESSSDAYTEENGSAPPLSPTAPSPSVAPLIDNAIQDDMQQGNSNESVSVGENSSRRKRIKVEIVERPMEWESSDRSQGSSDETKPVSGGLQSNNMWDYSTASHCMNASSQAVPQSARFQYPKSQKSHRQSSLVSYQDQPQLRQTRQFPLQNIYLGHSQSPSGASQPHLRCRSMPVQMTNPLQSGHNPHGPQRDSGQFDFNYQTQHYGSSPLATICRMCHPESLTQAVPPIACTQVTQNSESTQRHCLISAIDPSRILSDNRLDPLHSLPHSACRLSALCYERALLEAQLRAVDEQIGGTATVLDARKDGMDPGVPHAQNIVSPIPSQIEKVREISRGYVLQSTDGAYDSSSPRERKSSYSGCNSSALQSQYQITKSLVGSKRRNDRESDDTASLPPFKRRITRPGYGNASENTEATQSSKTSLSSKLLKIRKGPKSSKRLALSSLKKCLRAKTPWDTEDSDSTEEHLSRTKSDKVEDKEFHSAQSSMPSSSHEVVENEDSDPIRDSKSRGRAALINSESSEGVREDREEMSSKKPCSLRDGSPNGMETSEELDWRERLLVNGGRPHNPAKNSDEDLALATRITGLGIVPVLRPDEEKDKISDWEHDQAVNAGTSTTPKSSKTSSSQSNKTPDSQARPSLNPRSSSMSTPSRRGTRGIAQKKKTPRKRPAY